MVEGLILTLEEDEEDAEIDSEGEGAADHNPAVPGEEEQPGELDDLLNETPSPSSVQVTLEHNEAVYDVVVSTSRFFRTPFPNEQLLSPALSYFSAPIQGAAVPIASLSQSVTTNESAESKAAKKLGR